MAIGHSYSLIRSVVPLDMLTGMMYGKDMAVDLISLVRGI